MPDIKSFFGNFKERWSTKKSRNLRVLSLIFGLIIAFILFYVFCTQPGMLIRQSFEKTFIGTTQIREIEIYSSGELIHEFTGHYGIEQYQGYLVIINYDTHERTDIYGQTAVVINTLPEENITE